MPTLRQIKDRISAVEKIKKIADAMEIVSMTKLRRIEGRTIKARDYFNEIRNLLFSIGKSLSFEAHPALALHKDIKTCGLIVLSSDRGLCGNFNSNIFKRYYKFLSDNTGKKIVVVSIGKKGTAFFKKRREVKLLKEVPSSLKENPLKDASEISTTLLDMYTRMEIDELYMIYNQFKLQFLGSAFCERLFPLKVNTEGIKVKDYIFEPSPFSVMDNLVREYIANQIEHAILESNSAEEMARMLAMKQAKDNAQDLIGDLGLIYHKTRQAQITNELMDIISGAEGI